MAAPTLRLFLLTFSPICATTLLLSFRLTGRLDWLPSNRSTIGGSPIIVAGDVGHPLSRPPPSLQSVHLSEFSYVHWPAACTDPQPLLLGAVISAPSNVTRRRLLRRLYMSLAEHRGFRLRWVFILGSVPDAKLQAVVDKEAAVFGDIVQLSFRDSYENLTLKTLTAIDWTAAACPGAQFFFKTDEDCMVNPFRLVDSILSLKLSDSHHLYAGHIPYWLKPNRNRGARRWRVSYEDYPMAKFPSYTVGAGYLLSRLALLKVLGASGAIFPVRLEDVYVGLCAMRAGLAPTRLTPSFLSDSYNYSDWCEVRWSLVMHAVPPADMVHLWRHMTAPASLSQECGAATRADKRLSPTGVSGSLH